MKLSPHYLKRYKDLTMLFLKYGRTNVASRFELPDDHDGSGNGAVSADELPNDLERLGPTFVKLGQLLSSRADLLPPAYLKALSRLQDRVKPFRFVEVKDIVESELGTRLNKAFFCF